MSAPWLLVCALAAEALPVLGRMREVEVQGPRLVSGRLAGRAVSLLICGVGPTKAHRRTAEALERVPACGVLSFGTCGGLVDGLGVGDVLSASAVYREKRLVRELPPIPGALARRVTTVGAAVVTPERRSELADVADACEMEAAGVLAAAPGLRHAVLKVVSDSAGGDEGDNALVLDKLGWVRFQVRALEIMERDLLPVLLRWLAAQPLRAVDSKEKS